MITVKIIGGLGNQLFQYACGRALAHKHNTTLALDISAFETTYTLHKYSLNAFHIQEHFATQDHIAALTYRQRGLPERIILRLFRRPVFPPTHIREKAAFSFDPEILNLPDGIYLDGYWQTPHYFKQIAPSIRQEFTVKTPQIGQDRELARAIEAETSVSIHIRRGDYVSDPQTNQFHGSCSLKYFTECVRQLQQRVEKPHFFIFSDDPAWASHNVKLDSPTTIVRHNGADKNYEDLRLMSQCKHHIIANSTFSWWGAWLSQFPEKLVFAPRQWLKSNACNTDDLFPASWRRI